MGDTQLQVYIGMPAVVVSRAMCQVMESAQRVAGTPFAVLITGETGSGKEIVARAIHHYSLRCSKPWVDVNCAALPDQLMESELFGHEKGAFTGADAVKAGLFEMAHTGTLFLDEIGELAPKMQVKLLRVLDGLPYYRLGGQRKVTVDVRIVTATNRDLEQAVRTGLFRSDLYHRLNQYQIRIPPLSQRMEDIVPLAEYFLQQHGGAALSAEAKQALCRRAWPGNIRELRNAITHAVVNARHGEIHAADLPGNAAAAVPAAAPDAPLRLEGIERDTILQALESTGGHHQKAADLLGISRRTLTRKLRLYRMTPPTESAYVV
jgi:DNA-binding NtrC family response regulator